MVVPPPEPPPEEEPPPELPPDDPLEDPDPDPEPDDAPLDEPDAEPAGEPLPVVPPDFVPFDREPDDLTVGREVDDEPERDVDPLLLDPPPVDPVPVDPPAGTGGLPASVVASADVTGASGTGSSPEPWAPFAFVVGTGVGVGVRSDATVTTSWRESPLPGRTTSAVTARSGVARPRATIGS